MNTIMKKFRRLFTRLQAVELPAVPPLAAPDTTEGATTAATVPETIDIA